MAKRRRRRTSKLRPPSTPSNPGLRTQKKQLNSMGCPNHNMDFDLRDPPGVPSTARNIVVYPLMRLVKSEKGGGQAAGMAFVDDVYKCLSWLDRDTHAPPTWMDPEIFARMLVKDNEVSKICKSYVKKGSDGNRKALLKRIDEVYSEQYLVYMIEKFEEVSDLFAQWVVGYFAVKEEDVEIDKFYSKHNSVVAGRSTKKRRKTVR